MSLDRSTLADRLNLTEADREELTPNGHQRLLHNRVGWARTYLLKAGLLESPRRGVVKITQRGGDALATKKRRHHNVTGSAKISVSAVPPPRGDR